MRPGPRSFTCGSPTTPSRSALRCGSPGGRSTASSVCTRAKPNDKNTVQAFRYKVLRELEEDQAGLARPELRDRSGRLDPASLDTGHPSVTRAATPRGVAIPCPSAARRRPFCVGLDLGGSHPAPESSEAVNHLFPQVCVIQGSYPRRKWTPTSAHRRRKWTPYTSSRSDESVDKSTESKPQEKEREL